MPWDGVPSSGASAAPGKGKRKVVGSPPAGMFSANASESERPRKIRVTSPGGGSPGPSGSGPRASVKDSTRSSSSTQIPIQRGGVVSKTIR